MCSKPQAINSVTDDLWESNWFYVCGHVIPFYVLLAPAGGVTKSTDAWRQNGYQYFVHYKPQSETSSRFQQRFDWYNDDGIYVRALGSFNKHICRGYQAELRCEHSLNDFRPNQVAELQILMHGWWSFGSLRRVGWYFDCMPTFRRDILPPSWRPGDGTSMFLRNVGIQPKYYTAQEDCKRNKFFILQPSCIKALHTYTAIYRL